MRSTGWCTTMAAVATALAGLTARPVHAALTPGQLCEKTAVTALRKCDKTVAQETLSCQRKTDAGCLPGDAKIGAALSTLSDKVLGVCTGSAAVSGAGYSAALTTTGLVERLQEACSSTAASLAARSFGGPQAAARGAAADTDKDCLDYAFEQGRKMIDYAQHQQDLCVLAAHAGKACDPIKTNEKIATRQAKTVDKIGAKCADLAALVAVDPAAFVARALDQAQCLVAAGHGQTAPLTLSCGPRAAIALPPPATSTQIVLDNATYGTKCGDGSDYAFWVRLAPNGQPINKVVVFMVGGGSCGDGPTCAATDPNLFESLNDTFGNGVGVTNSVQASNPFRDWTKVYLPYCTQDLHTGGGIVNVFPEMTVYRYGAVNVRASLRYVRDMLWNVMDANDPEGFRPDRLTVLFSGSSAGGGGASFNYHYLLDDLRWVHSTLLPDSSLGMDNGMGAAALRGQLALQTTTPGWNALPYAAPYCFEPQCAEFFPTAQHAESARLKGTPEQQILNVANQVDNVERNVGDFATTQDYVNTLRTKYCQQQGTPGVFSFFYDSTPYIHGLINVNAEWNNDSIDGVALRDWVGNAMSAPDAVQDRIGLGTLETDYPGIQPFPCTLP